MRKVVQFVNFVELTQDRFPSFVSVHQRELAFWVGALKLQSSTPRFFGFFALFRVHPSPSSS